MTRIDLEELGRRLRELSVESPEPAVVTARVLEMRRSQHARRSWSIPRPVRPLAAVAGMLLVVWSSFYFCPVAGATLADTPLGSFSTFVLEEAGLASQGAILSEDSSASHSGVTVRLFGVSANPIQMAVLLRFTPLGAEPIFATMTDQFGASYELHGGYGDLRTGDQVLIFAPPNGLTSTLGMRFTLTLTIMDPNHQLVPGSWVIHGIALTHRGLSIPAPEGAKVDGVTVTFSAGREADGIIELPVRLRGITVDQLGLSQKQQPGQVPPLGVEVDSSGRQLDGTFQFAPDSEGISLDILAYGAASHGTYTLQISIQGVGVVTRLISY